MVELQQVADVATPLAVGCAVLFGVLQYRQFEKKRRDLASMEMLHTFASHEFTRAFGVVINLPADLTPENVRKLEPDTIDAIRAVGHTCETIALLVYKRSIPLEDVEELLGSNVREIWRKIRPWAEHRRKQAGDETPYEWTQWLAERLEDRARTGRTRGAFVEYRDWTS